MFDLNDEKKFGGISIFNGGVAGVVKNVTIDRVEKKASDDVTRGPDYKVFYKDAQGVEVNQPWWYFKPWEGSDAAKIEKDTNSEVSRIRSLGVAVMGKTFEFPPVKDTTEALDVIMKLVQENAGNNKFNVFATYGTDTKPSIYIGIRKYNFIEPATEDSGLTVGKSDLMERIEPDKTPDVFEQATMKEPATTVDWTK